MTEDSTMPWIRTIAPEDATGDLADAYAWQARRLGQPTEFTQLGSLAPEIVHARLALYRSTERLQSGLSSFQKVLLAYVTSSANETPHCISQIRLKLVELGTSEETIRALDSARFEVLEPSDEALARYARRLTRDPGSIQAVDIDRLRELGFDDLDILDANNQVAHLNYVNRIANGLGLRHEVTADFEAFAAIPA
jgi:uncharacterized peroxidase-related enzyme